MDTSCRQHAQNALTNGTNGKHVSRYSTQAHERQEGLEWTHGEWSRVTYLTNPPNPLSCRPYPPPHPSSVRPYSPVRWRPWADGCISTPARAWWRHHPTPPSVPTPPPPSVLTPPPSVRRDSPVRWRPWVAGCISTPARAWCGLARAACPAAAWAGRRTGRTPGRRSCWTWPRRPSSRSPSTPRTPSWPAWLRPRETGPSTQSTRSLGTWGRAGNRPLCSVNCPKADAC